MITNVKFYTHSSGGGVSMRGNLRPLPLVYPRMILSQADRTRLLARPEILRNGWNLSRLEELLTKLRGIINNLQASMGKLPELFFFIDRIDEEHPDGVIAMSPLDRRFIIFLSGKRGSEFVLENIERLLCERLGAWFLNYSTRAQSQWQSPEAFLWEDSNPYLKGLQFEVGEIRKLFGARSEGPANKFIEKMASIAPVYVKAKVTRLLCPQRVVGCLQKTFEEAMIKEIEKVSKEFRETSSLDMVIIRLANAAAFAQMWGFRPLALMVERSLKSEILPLQAESELAEIIRETRVAFPVAVYDRVKRKLVEDLRDKAISLFRAVKDAYVRFFEGIEIRHFK